MEYASWTMELIFIGKHLSPTKSTDDAILTSNSYDNGHTDSSSERFRISRKSWRNVSVLHANKSLTKCVLPVCKGF